MGQRTAPQHGQVADDMCFIRSMNTDAINHEPAITFFQTGTNPGRPAPARGFPMGWAAQSEPAALCRDEAMPTNMQHLQAIWPDCGERFPPGEYAGVAFRTTGDPILYINNPPGVPTESAA